MRPHFGFFDPRPPTFRPVKARPVKAMIDFANIPFIEAGHGMFKDLTGQPARPWDLIVVHDMEADETQLTAENVARWFATVRPSPTSAHYCVDNDSIVQSVQLRDVAFAAPNANRNGIHIELAGYARQTRADWLDEFSTETLLNAAELIATVIAPKTGIPVVFRNADALKRHERGITTHLEVTKAFNPGGHTDPGPNFPMAGFIGAIEQLQAGKGRDLAQKILRGVV